MWLSAQGGWDVIFSFQCVLTTDLCYPSPRFSHLKTALTHFRWWRNWKFLTVFREARLFYSCESISHHSRQPRKASLFLKKKSFSTLWSSTLNVKMRWFKWFILKTLWFQIHHFSCRYSLPCAEKVFQNIIKLMTGGGNVHRTLRYVHSAKKQE